MRTVENDVVDALGGRSCVAAGRTDRDVSALSQVRKNRLTRTEQYTALRVVIRTGHLLVFTPRKYIPPRRCVDSIGMFQLSKE